MPPIPFAEKMATKSNVAVLDVMEEDPATNHGALQVCLKLMSHVPTISNCGEIHQKTMVAGDQGVAERFRTAVLSRTEEKSGERLSALVCQPMDFHAMKVKHILTRISWICNCRLCRIH